MVDRVLSLALLLALVASSGACLVRDNPCADDSNAPAWLQNQCVSLGSEESAEGDSGTAETSAGSTSEDSGGDNAVACESRADCCPDPQDLSTCAQKCVFVGDGRRLCHGSGLKGLNQSCDILDEPRRDTCDRLHVCVAHRERTEDVLDDEGYCKPLCDEQGSCPGLPSGYACSINDICRRYCDPQLDECEDDEGCRWIFDETRSRLDCQPVDVSGGCIPQLKPDQPGGCPSGSMCIEELDNGLTTWRCAQFCTLGGECPNGTCESFTSKMPLDQRPEPPHISSLGFCSE